MTFIGRKYIVDDESKAIWIIKATFRNIKWQDYTLSRAREYDVLKSKRYMFIRDGKGCVYEVNLEQEYASTYSEEYLNEALILYKYTKFMLNRETIKFLDNIKIKKVFEDSNDILKTIETICATLIAVGYDENWINDIFKPKLIKIKQTQ